VELDDGSITWAPIDIDEVIRKDERPEGPASWVYIDNDGKEQGPYSTQDICWWFAAGYLTAERLVKKAHSTDDFATLTSIPELARHLAAYLAAYGPDQSKQSEQSEQSAWGHRPALPDAMLPPVGQQPQTGGAATADTSNRYAPY
jgi:hypothetical protein